MSTSGQAEEPEKLQPIQIRSIGGKYKLETVGPENEAFKTIIPLLRSGYWDRQTGTRIQATLPQGFFPTGNEGDGIEATKREVQEAFHKLFGTNSFFETKKEEDRYGRVYIRLNAAKNRFEPLAELANDYVNYHDKPFYPYETLEEYDQAEAAREKRIAKYRGQYQETSPPPKTGMLGYFGRFIEGFDSPER